MISDEFANLNYDLTNNIVKAVVTNLWKHKNLMKKGITKQKLEAICKNLPNYSKPNLGRFYSNPTRIPRPDAKGSLYPTQNSDLILLKSLDIKKNSVYLNSFWTKGEENMAIIGIDRLGYIYVLYYYDDNNEYVTKTQYKTISDLFDDEWDIGSFILHNKIVHCFYPIKTGQWYMQKDGWVFLKPHSMPTIQFFQKDNTLCYPIGKDSKGILWARFGNDKTVSPCVMESTKEEFIENGWIARHWIKCCDADYQRPSLPIVEDEFQEFEDEPSPIIHQIRLIGNERKPDDIFGSLYETIAGRAERLYCFSHSNIHEEILFGDTFLHYTGLLFKPIGYDEHLIIWGLLGNAIKISNVCEYTDSHHFCDNGWKHFDYRGQEVGVEPIAPPKKTSPKNSFEIKGTDTPAESSDKECIACLTNTKTVAYNCGHICYCITCHNTAKAKVCPMCKTNISTSIKLFQ